VATRSAHSAKIVQTTGDLHGLIRRSVCEVAKLIFGNPTDLDPGDGMLHPHTDPRQFSVMPFLGWR
jgi:hypothetical protein